MKKRCSNFELLRIFAMFIIVLFHVMSHWPKDQIINVGLQNYFNNGLFSNPIFYRKLWIITTAMPMGLVGNGLFMMITGYFMLDRVEINLIKISKKILLQLGYATIILMILSCFIYRTVFSTSERYLSLSLVTDFNTEWWFIGYYFAVMIIAAFLLNKYMMNVEKKKALMLIVALFSAVEIGWSGELLDAIGTGCRSLGIGIFFYLLGGYIHKYDPFKKVRGFILILVILLANMVNYISSYNETMNNIQAFVRNGSQGTFIQSIPQPENYNILVVLIVVSVFEIFKRIKMPNIKIINYLGSSTFMVYLIHENSLFKSIYNQTDCITILYNHPFLFIVEILKWTIVGFAAGVLAYTIFNIGTKICNRFLWIAINTKGNEKINNNWC